MRTAPPRPQLQGFPNAGATNAGLLTAADWSVFNAKQASLGFTAENAAKRGVANGYAALGGTGTVPTGQLPLATTNSVGVVRPGANMTVDAFGVLSVAAPYSLPPANTGALGGVRSYTAPTHQFFTGLSTLGIFTSAQPTTSDIAGLGSIATAAATDYIRTNVIGQPNGVPSLSSIGLVPKAQLPLNGPQQIVVNGSTMLVRPKLEFRNGTNATFIGTDDGSGTTTITVSATGGGGGTGGTTYNAGTGLVLTGTTFSLPTLITPSTCGDATHSCRLTYDAQGRITGTSAVTITGSGAGQGNSVTADTNFTAGHAVIATGATSLTDSGLTLPSSNIVGISDPQTLTNKSIAAAQLTGTIPAARLPGFTGDVTSTSGTSSLSLATANTSPGTCGDSTHSCALTVDSKGRVTAQTPVSISAASVTPAQSYAFTNQTSVTITHNLGTTAVSLTCFDASNNWMEPGSWRTTDLNNIAVNFSTARTGRCVPISIAAGSGSSTPALSVQANGGLTTTPSTLNFIAGTNTNISASSAGSTTNLTITSTASGSSTGTVTNTAGNLTNGQLIVGNGTTDVKVGNLSGDVSTSGSTVTTLANVNANVGTFGSSSAIPVVTVNAKGLITGVSTVTAATGGPGSGSGVPAGTLASIPSGCSVGQLYFATDAAVGQQLYECSSTGSWNQYTALGGSGALAITGGSLDIVSSVVPMKAAANSFTGVNTFTQLAITSSTPSSSSAACVADTIWRDANFLYLCVSSGSIKRIAWTTF
jgi:hypothetical protein